jgi:hypothetical protein
MSKFPYYLFLILCFLHSAFPLLTSYLIKTEPFGASESEARPSLNHNLIFCTSTFNPYTPSSLFFQPLPLRDEYAGINGLRSIFLDVIRAPASQGFARMDSASDSALSSPLSSPASSPLSFRSKSPTPPCDYPSPSLTLSGSRSPSKTRDTSATVIDQDVPPPKKKRKLAQQKPRTTEYFDLAAHDESSQEGKASNGEIQFQRLLDALRTKQKIIVIAGAGISVSAGSTLLNTASLKPH